MQRENSSRRLAAAVDDDDASSCAFEFDTAAARSALTGARILDWFHIAMKFMAEVLRPAGH